MRRKFPSQIDWSEGVTLGRYVVFDRLASGGTAAVHVGKLAGMGGFSRVVAIKKLHEHVASDPKFVAMLLDEARLVSGLRHPNIVPTLDIVEDGESIALVMDYVHGLSLFHAMRTTWDRNETVPTSIALAIVLGVLQGLGAAHEATASSGEPMKIVHRDVSPQNVLVGSDGHARIVDFGIAQASERLQTTQSGEVKGKVAYMSPEQVTGEEVDCRSDIFAVGVMLWELLTSKRLFYAKTEGHTVSNVLNKQVEAPLAMGGLFAASAVNAVVMRALERDVRERYASCAEMAEALEDVMAPAKPREVAAWLDSVDAEHLAAQRDLVRRVEASSMDSPVPSSPRVSQLLAAVSAPTRDGTGPRPPAASASSRGPFVGDSTPRPPPAQHKTPIAVPKPLIRKVRSSSDSAITSVRIGSKNEIDEIRKLYERGDIAAALVRAETVRVEDKIALTSVPRVDVTPAELLRLPLDHRAGFMLTQVDGKSDVEAILHVAAMPEDEALEVLGKLLTVGALSIVGSANEGDAPTLPPKKLR